jgi:protease PrsW
MLLIALLGGLLPALLWLAFWLFEDRCQPEPKRYIFYTFILGMLGVLVALQCEEWAIPYLDPAFTASQQVNGPLLVVWAAIEELVKFAAAYVALRSYFFDEPLDAIMYLVTAALGFSAGENVLFIFGALQKYGALQALAAGDLRFIGATLLHTLSSATIGVALALSFYKSKAVRWLSVLCGVILAIVLHTLFNFFILGEGGDTTFWIFLCIWFGIIAMLLLIERIKEPARDYC